MKTSDLVLYASCIPVRGYTRSLIYRLQEAQYNFIPNSLCDLLLAENGHLHVPKILANLSNDDQYIFNDYIQFLIDKRLAFWTNTPDLFPRMKDDWESPSLITNAVICIEEIDIAYLLSLVKQLEDLLCQCIELRFQTYFSHKAALQILSLFDHSIIESIEILVINYNDWYDIQWQESIVEHYPRVKRITLYNSKNYYKNIINDVIIEHIPQPFLEEKCGTVTHRSLIFSFSFYTEAIHFNSCLNRKLCVDSHGNIKNCPCSTHFFGNIQNDSLQSVVRTPEFQSLGKISKDMIEICKFCEFRYACPDCRIHTVHRKRLSHPEYCKYNPFIGRWEHEEGFLSVDSCGKYDDSGIFHLYPEYVED